MTKKKSQKKISSLGENPFNIKINRNKFSVLGQKIKGTRGLPGVSRSLGNAKRKEEYHKKKIQSQKSSKFVDKRLIDSSLSYEEQATLRLVEERKKKLKKNIFNLNDEESLTHKGIPLENHKNFNDAVNDSDEEEQLDPKFVKQAHFGGFADDSESAPKSRKEIIDDLIVESKRRKMERKMEKEKNEALIEKLDEQWKEMHQKYGNVIKGKKKEVESGEKDPFDVLVSELKFEARTAPPVRVKTPEQIAREEKERLKKLEEERNKRMMNPMDDTESKDNQLSADSIYDGLDIQFEPVDDQENDYIKVNANENSEDDESEEDSSRDSEDENDLNDTMDDNDIESTSMTADDSDFPDTVEKLCIIIDNQSTEIHVIVENIIKDKIKSKSKQNIEKLESFFVVLLEYIMNSKNITKNLKVLDDILPSLYTLAEVSPHNTTEKVLSFLDEEYTVFQRSKGKKMKKHFPRFQSLVLFKVISSLYSVSDFKHPVVTPAIIFMCDVLGSGYVVTFQNIYSRLFISKVMYGCVSFSKRYVPEVLHFLNKTLELTLNKDKKFNLVIDEDVFERVQLNFKKSDKSCNNAVKASIIYEIIELLHEFALLYQYLQCFNEIFAISLDIASKLVMTGNFSCYPDFLKNTIENYIKTLESVKKTYKPLVFENKKPVPLKLFEPAFDSKFTRKKDDIQKKRKLIKNVNQKIRKEEKSLLREMRRDNQVIAAEIRREA